MEPVLESVCEKQVGLPKVVGACVCPDWLVRFAGRDSPRVPEDLKSRGKFVDLEVRTMGYVLCFTHHAGRAFEGFIQ